MTRPEFDPVENWLSSDIELLPPRPGSFERVHRRARRRKTVVAMSAAAGVAVVVVAAAVLPQVASALLPGHGSGQADVGGVTSSRHASPGPGATERPSPSGKALPSPLPGTSGKSYLAAPGLSITNSTARAAAGFAPTSVTFFNQSEGAALGTAACPAGSCTTVAGTPDYGKTWTKAGAPPAGPPDGATGVSQLRFLDTSHGWAFGPELFVTADGGATWTRVKGLPGRVIDLATVNGSAYAVVATCGGTGVNFAAGCTRFTLYSSPYNVSDWQPVAGAAASLPVTPGGLQLTTSGGYLLAGPVLYSGSTSGGSWQAVSVTSGPAPAGSVPACLNGTGHRAGSGESGLIAPGAGVLYLLCQQVSGGSPGLYQSADGGQTWQVASHPNVQGTATSLAVAPVNGTLVVSTDAGLYYSPDGRSWHRASLGAGAAGGGARGGGAPAGGFGFVGMTTASDGVALPADPGLKEIFLTTDTGRTWHPKRI